MSVCPEVRLMSGVCMPMLGLGTSHKGGFDQDTVRLAMQEVGYRHVDTAQRYNTEQEVGLALRQAEGVDRDQVFITTKLWPGSYGYQSCLEQADLSLARLGTDYLDLYLLHWPEALNSSTVEETWRAMELLLESGKVKAIGVSNFQERHLQRLFTTATVVPRVNQIEFHPYQQDRSLVGFCEENKIVVEGFSPLGKGTVLGEKQVLKVAKEVGVTPAQVLIRWSLQNGVVTIPKSTNIKRVRENFAVWHFQLTESHMTALNSLHQNLRVTWDSSQVL